MCRAVSSWRRNLPDPARADSGWTKLSLLVSLRGIRGLHGSIVLPAHRVVSALVYAAHASDVRHVFVGGEMLVKDGRLTRWNLAELCREFEARARHIMEKEL